jgi:DNA (cytosine-5)-methyltransferase 1
MVLRTQIGGSIKTLFARVINSDNQLYKQAGNSVTVTVVLALGIEILKCMNENEEEAV